MFPRVGTVMLVLVYFAFGARAQDQSILEQIKSAEEAGSVTNFALISQKLEVVWPQDPASYFQGQNQLTKALEIISATNRAARRLLEHQAELALAKKCPNDALIVAGCLSAKEAIVERIARITATAPTLSLAKVMAESLGEVRSTIVTNFQGVLVSANVAPPVFPASPLPTNGIRILNEGMDLNLIDDPFARDAYKKSIAENNSRQAQNVLQFEVLPKMNRAMTSTLLNYIRSLLAQNPKTRSEVLNLATTAHLTEEEQRQLKQY